MALGARERRGHQCGRRLMIYQADGASSCAVGDGVVDLASYMEGYRAVLLHRGLGHMMPVRAELLSAVGRILERWGSREGASEIAVVEEEEKHVSD